MDNLDELLNDPDRRLEDVALAIAADEYPRLDQTLVHQELDHIAARIAAPLGGFADNRLRLSRLCEEVYGALGFRGSDDYDDKIERLLDELTKVLFHGVEEFFI